MNSTQNPEESGPSGDAVAAPKQARQFRHINEQVSESEPNSGRHPSELQKHVTSHRSSLGRLALQGIVGLLVAACIGAAAMILRSNDDAAKQATVRLISSPAAASPVSAQSALPVTAQTPLAGSAPTAASPSPEQEQLAGLLRGFLAVMEQDIGELKTSIEQLKTSMEQLKTGQEEMVRHNSAVDEQLKAAQEQIVRNNAAVADQLKATQEQLARLIAKDSEQQLRPKTSALQPRSIASSTGKPAPTLSLQQTRAQPPAR
jgi:hypothetical protein